MIFSCVWIGSNKEYVLLVNFILVQEGIVDSQQLENDCKSVVLQDLIVLNALLFVLNIFKLSLEILETFRSYKILSL